VPLSSDYHRRQATTLIQLARTTDNAATAKALLKLAAEYIDLAEQAARPLQVAPVTNENAAA
jgi:hypothetical protein